VKGAASLINGQGQENAGRGRCTEVSSTPAGCLVRTSNLGQVRSTRSLTPEITERIHWVIIDLPSSARPSQSASWAAKEQ